MNAPEQTVLWSPQPGPQTALLECPIFEVFYGGARGGGKTESSIGDWLQHSSLYGEAAVGIFFRRKLVQLAEVIARTKQIFPKLGAKYNEQQKTWTMANGARLKFAYLERDSDAEEYQGHNYTRVYIEEVTNFPSPAPIDKLRATLRSGGGVPSGMRLTGNPGGAGHNWVKKRYIDPAPSGFEVLKEFFAVIMHDRPVRVWHGGAETTMQLFGVHPVKEQHDDGTVTISSGILEIRLLEQVLVEVSQRVFIPSRISDNGLLMQNDPLYILRLRQSGSEALVKAWLEGNWDIVDGAFFDEWDEFVHVLPTNEFLALRNPGMSYFRGFDWGSAKPFSVGWYAILDKEYRLGERCLPKGALVKFREWYGSTGPNKGLKMTADLVAQGIVEREKGERIRYGVADPAIFIRDGGPSIGETMAIHKCMWRRADNKRKAGWEQLRQRLVGQNGLPMLYFCDCCEDTIRTLPTLQHDETDPEDLDTEAEDHAADETRYAVMSRPWVPKAAPIAGPGLPKLPGQYTINELVERQRQRRVEALEF